MLQQPYNPHPLSQFVIALKTHQTLKSVILPVKRKNKCYYGLCVQLLGGGGISPSNITRYKRGPRGTAFVEGMTGYHCTLTCVQVYGKIVFPPNMTY